MQKCIGKIALACISIGLAIPGFGRAQSDVTVTLQNGLWQLVQIRSMDDSEWTPVSGKLYTLRFLEDGTLQLHSDCKSGIGNWTSEGNSQLLIGPITATNAACGPDSLHNRFLRELSFARSYLFRDERLFLATKADGSIIEFRQATNDGPSFDCTAASGSVQESICDNAVLAEFDRRLDHLYRKALETFPDDELRELKAYQRGWIKGRDDCWKADNQLHCVTEEYRSRITELQIEVADTEVPAATNFVCSDDNVASVYFYNDTEIPALVINRHPDQALLFKTGSASGAKYVGRNIAFWQKVLRRYWNGMARRYSATSKSRWQNLLCVSESERSPLHYTAGY